MSSGPIGADTLKQLLRFQKDEITGYHAYRMLAERVKDAANSAIVPAHLAEALQYRPRMEIG